jgi:hypothetical protein
VIKPSDVLVMTGREADLRRLQEWKKPYPLKGKKE